MARHSIAVIAGDGAGPEVVAEALKVLRAASEVSESLELDFEMYPWGSKYYLERGRVMPEDGAEQLRRHDAILFGAVGDPRVPDPINQHGLILHLRRVFDQYVNERPVYLFPGVRSPLADKKPGEIDMVVVRENTEGEYADVGGVLYAGTPQELAIQTGVFTRRGTERVVRYAFELARRRGGKRRVTSVSKCNVQRFSMALWDRVFWEVARDYSDIEANAYLIDAAAMNFVRKPEEFDVVVASNLFGDILTDLSAAIAGGLGLAPGANICPERTHPSMFEPIHGSAPDIAGRGIANPLGAILAGQMMLEFLGEEKAARLVREAITENLAKGAVRTPDLAGTSSTSAVGDDVVRILRAKAR